MVAGDMVVTGVEEGDLLALKAVALLAVDTVGATLGAAGVACP